MPFRHEWKHEINLSDMIALRHRLKVMTTLDSHAIDGKYEIRSLYFDNLNDKALREKLDGVNNREKFRLRCYNGDTSCIYLEKKSKTGNLSKKTSVVLNRQEAAALTEGSYGWMLGRRHPLINELYTKITIQGMRPKTIVDYTREPYIYAPANVRITMDYNIRTGLFHTNFLESDCPTVPIPGSPAILEVKWDEWLPDIIRDAIQLPGRRSVSFSKYAACRIYD